MRFLALAACLLAWPATAEGLVVKPVDLALQGYLVSAMAPVPQVTVERRYVGCTDEDRFGRVRTFDACVTGGNPPILWAPPRIDRAAFYHELGHIFAIALMGDVARQRFSNLTHRPGPWYQGPDRLSPSEAFADAYEFCALYGSKLPRWARGPTYYAYPLVPRLHRRVCRLIERTAALGSTGSR